MFVDRSQRANHYARPPRGPAGFYYPVSDAATMLNGTGYHNHIWHLMLRAGMEDLSNIVRVRRLTLAGHILWLPPDRPASVSMQ